MTYLRAGLALAMSLGAIGCGSSSDDDDDSSEEPSELTLEDFKVQCWHGQEGDVWRFDALVDDVDGPEDVASVYVEVRPANGDEALTEFSLDVTYNASPCWYTTFSTYQDNISCGNCENYGFKVYATDFNNETNDRIFPGTVCSSTDGLPPDDYDYATPSPFCQ